MERFLAERQSATPSRDDSTYNQRRLLSNGRFEDVRIVIIGPIFWREAVTAPRRPQHFVYRTVYVAALLILMGTAWMLTTGTQKILTVGDIARFGSALFRLLAPLQLALLTFLGALTAASNVAQEKDKKTILLLLMTRLSNSELVLGKLLASLLEVFTMLAAALPVFVMITLFGGVSLQQIASAYAVTIVTILVAGSLGNLLALWREKTFQTLAMTALGIVLWVALAEMLAALLGTRRMAGVSADVWATGFSPLRAIYAAVSPGAGLSSQSLLGNGLPLFFVVGSGLAATLCGIAMLRVRVWNPSRDARVQQPETAEEESAKSAGLMGPSSTNLSADAAEHARRGHVDSRVRAVSQDSRSVWDNPILWREMCTWAYGRKVLIIRLAYLGFTVLAAVGLYYAIAAQGMHRGSEGTAGVPPAAQPLAPFCLISLVIVNALAVTSITNERDGGALDLLLVTDLTPREFLLGKLLGVAYVTKEMIVAPMLLCCALWWWGGLTLENLAYSVGGLLVMDAFVMMLGVHCGMIYANSRSAIGVSLGTVFFLFLGVVTLLALMVSFSGSFQRQLAPFLAFIVGGGVGIYVTLGARNPSPAIGLASIVLPFATFFAVTSFLLNQPLNVFLVTSFAYGLTVAALMIPALSEFDFAMGRSKERAE